MERKCDEERRQWIWRNLGNFDIVYEAGVGEGEKGLFGSNGYDFKGLETMEQRMEMKRLKKLERERKKLEAEERKNLKRSGIGIFDFARLAKF